MNKAIVGTFVLYGQSKYDGRRSPLCPGYISVRLRLERIKNHPQKIINSPLVCHCQWQRPTPSTIIDPTGIGLMHIAMILTDG